MINVYEKENIFNFVNKSNLTENFSLNQKGAISEILSELINEIMINEKNIFLSENIDKANGFYNRNVQTSSGKLELNVPRVRNNSFRPNVLPDKYTRFDSSFEELLKSLLINGDSKSEIISKLRDNALNYSPTAFDDIYENLKNKIKDFKTSILDENYFFVYINAYQTKVKDLKDSRVKVCNIYSVIAVDFNANKRVIGFYPVFGNENKDTWKSVFQNLIYRGMKKVLLFICDDFSGISDAIKTFFPYSYIQKCFVHLQRNVFRNTSKQDAKDIMATLKQVKNSNSFDKAFNIFNEDIIKVYSQKYPDYIKQKKKDNL